MRFQFRKNVFILQLVHYHFCVPIQYIVTINLKNIICIYTPIHSLFAIVSGFLMWLKVAFYLLRLLLSN